MDFLLSFDRPLGFYTLTLNADKTHGNRQLSKLDFWKNNLSKTRMPHTQLSFWWKYIYHKKLSWVWGILKIHFDAFVKRKKLPVAKTCKNSGKVKNGSKQSCVFARYIGIWTSKFDDCFAFCKKIGRPLRHLLIWKIVLSRNLKKFQT